MAIERSNIKNYLRKKRMRQDKILKGIISIYDKNDKHKSSIFYMIYKLNWTISIKIWHTEPLFIT